ncbi:BrnT family toxin [Bosea sp. PAMC 26642]|uniref:BrnT family toxin n=1 Tax=Bosea sp. (strain PAMC 26642) TaxID=1792307 RepID=UPI0009EB67BA|nr:BrnT family toxin [Bosea sp. PAMC 26642]
MRFEWDPAKAESNARKHGIRFETATRVFADPLALTEYSGAEGGEHRWNTIGMIDTHLLLVVVHTDRNDCLIEVLRIISARPADRKEKRRYEQDSQI